MPRFPNTQVEQQVRRLALALLLFAGSNWAAAAPNVRISGADEALAQNIQGHVSLPTAGCDTAPGRLARFVPGIRKSVTRAARALGYYFLDQRVSFVAAEGCWALEIAVEPGEPVRIGSIEVDVLGDRQPFAEVLNAMPLSVGDPLNHHDYEQIKAALSSRAMEYGYFSARFQKAQLLLDLKRRAADIRIEFAPGERYEFDAVTIDPLAELSDPFLRRFIEFEPGAPYSSEALRNLRNALNDSMYFSDVSVTPVLNIEEHAAVPVRVSLRMRPRRAYAAGLGLTTDTGPRLRLDYSDRYLNRDGHRFDINSTLSPVQQGIDINYSIPMRKPATELLRLSGGIQREDNDTFVDTTSKLAAEYSFLNRHDWRQRYFLDFQRDDFTLAGEDRRTDFLIGGISLSRSRADDAIYPQNGWHLFARLRGASDALLSEESFAQLFLSGRLVHKLGPGRVLLKVQAAATLVDDVAELPVSLQFFAGGDQSVRGYKYQSLGPLNADGAVVGGKHLLVGGIEYDFNIRPDWKMAVFFDAGNAFSDFSDYGAKRAAGIGFRWLSPIGPIRVDFASPLDNDDIVRIHVTMGLDL